MVRNRRPSAEPVFAILVKKFIAACLLAGFTVCTADADIIYFRDGMKTICQERAWEEDDQVKCEYGGWTITYQKADVLRILKTTPPKSKAQPEKQPLSVQKPAPSQASPEKIAVPKTRGTAFYDPRRPFKYWSDKNSKHKTYQEAVQALAEKYGRSPEWIQAHMGDSNDLEQIHRNLSDPTLSPDLPASNPQISNTPGIVFYNPRRSYPYWTSETSKHKSYKEAIEALAELYGRSPEWIRQNMGSSNDLTQINQNLSQRLSGETSH
jgi:hypothetical protein